MGLLFIGNSVFTNTEEGLSRTYKNSLTGDFSVSARSEDGFTLFGSELPLIGEFFKIPLIARYDEVSEVLKKQFPLVQTQPVVIGAGKLSLGDFNAITPFFAAKLDDYFHFFPDLKLVSGSIPAPGVPSVFLNQRMFERVKASLKKEPAPGEKFLLSAAVENSFVLREVAFAGVFAYPVSDPLLDNVILIDAPTGRQLNAYYVSSAKAETPEQTSLTSGNVDDMFSEARDTVVDKSQSLSLQDVHQEIRTQSDAPVADPGTWNFILMRGKDSGAHLVGMQTDAAFGAAGLEVQVRDWRDTAGGNAKIVWFLQFFFNLGLIFISLVACLIVMNSLSLSVAERVKEIGTLRALGAQKSKVASLIGFETVILVTGAGILGVMGGAFVMTLTAKLGGVPLTNPLIASLFGTTRYLPHVSMALMAEHFALSLILGFMSMGLPIRKALNIAPIQAMARE